MEPDLPRGLWKDTYKNHFLGLARFLEKRNRKIQGENFVYLAGLIARRLDKDYCEDTESFLLEDPMEIDLVVRKHAPFIGQNAPVVTISRINAEYTTISLALKEKSVFRQFELRIPGKFFGIASTYSYQAGNRSLGEVYGFFSRKIHEIAEILGEYLDSLEGNLPEENPITDGLWTEFQVSKNLRNEKKEIQEKRNIIEKPIERDSEVDVQKILRGTFSFN